MLNLKEMHKFFIRQRLREGCVAVDFTMGNGNDTLFLSETVGQTGKVYAFDVQEAALKSTRRRLEEAGAPQNYTLICDSHHKVKDYINEPITAGMFNLGYLPGGDKSLTTMRETTMPAVEAAIELLAPDGALIIAVYPGHNEGALEGEMLKEYFKTTSRFEICPTEIKILNSPDSPYFFLVEKRGK